jgi:hypothetical protein
MSDTPTTPEARVDLLAELSAVLKGKDALCEKLCMALGLPPSPLSVAVNEAVARLARRSAPTPGYREGWEAFRTAALKAADDAFGGVTRDEYVMHGPRAYMLALKEALRALPLPESALLTQPAVPEKEVVHPAASSDERDRLAGTATPGVTLKDAKEGVAPVHIEVECLGCNASFAVDRDGDGAPAPVETREEET